MEEEHKECLFLKIDVEEAACVSHLRTDTAKVLRDRHFQEELIDDYQVKVMPTFVLFKNGQKVAQLEGNVPDQLKEAIQKYK